MEKNEQMFFSENPEFDIWNNLKNYSYNEYLTNFFNHRKVNFDERLLETISGSISQSFEYFEASKVVSIQTAPLFLYYGSINLLFAACCLKNGKIVEVSGHGMSLKKDTLDFKDLLNTEVDIHNNKGAGFALYFNILSEGNINQKFSLKLEEIFSSLPELYREFFNINKHRKLQILPLIRMISDDFEVYKSQLKTTQYDYSEDIEKSKNFKNTFLDSQKNGDNELLFYLRLGANSNIRKSFLGDYYLPLEVRDTPIIESMFLGIIALYVLATIGRYHTNVWSLFIKNNKNGLVNFIEKFLNVMRRYFPNYILDNIEGKKHKFTNEIVSTEDYRSQMSEKELEGKIRNIMNGLK